MDLINRTVNPVAVGLRRRSRVRAHVESPLMQRGAEVRSRFSVWVADQSATRAEVRRHEVGDRFDPAALEQDIGCKDQVKGSREMHAAPVESLELNGVNG